MDCAGDGGCTDRSHRRPSGLPSFLGVIPRVMDQVPGEHVVVETPDLTPEDARQLNRTKLHDLKFSVFGNLLALLRKQGVPSIWGDLQARLHFGFDPEELQLYRRADHLFATRADTHARRCAGGFTDLLFALRHYESEIEVWTLSRVRDTMAELIVRNALNRPYLSVECR